MATIQITHLTSWGLFVTAIRRSSELLVHYPVAIDCITNVVAEMIPSNL